MKTITVPAPKGKFHIPELPSAKPVGWVKKEKPKDPLKPKKSKIKKTKRKQQHYPGGQQSTDYEPQRKPHLKPRRPKKLTPRQVRNIQASQDRAIPNLIAMGHEFDMLTGKWKVAPEFGV